jgi:hypothetical protein
MADTVGKKCLVALGRKSPHLDDELDDCSASDELLAGD